MREPESGVLIGVNMSRVKRRKPRPQPPWYYWYDTDGCWDCPNRNGCSGCKRLKTYIHEQQRTKRKVARDEKRLLDNS